MAPTIEAKPVLPANSVDMEEDLEIFEPTSSPSKSPQSIETTPLPTLPSPSPSSPTTSTYHIYTTPKCHKLISPLPLPTHDRRFGPTPKQLRALRNEPPISDHTPLHLRSLRTSPTAFFLYKPYLAFHLPPFVLHSGYSKLSTTPVILLSHPCLWRSYKLQVLADPAGVLDPRGVVSWRHNGDTKGDEHALKGYKVRGWRLWGEAGKAYVHGIKASRLNGTTDDPDIPPPRTFSPARASEVVYLRWTSPFSRHTRTYHFRFRGLDFIWKGTGTVKETRRCGAWLRFNHLKLVVRVPLNEEKKGNGEESVEVCIAKFTSSVAKVKGGVLEVYDGVILRLCEEGSMGLLDLSPRSEDEKGTAAVMEDDMEKRLSQLKKSTLYQLIMATALCMISSEKEKRHTLIDFLLQAAEGGGGAG